MTNKRTFCRRAAQSPVAPSLVAIALPLPAGTHRIRVRTERGTEIEHQVEIVDGEAHVIELRLP